MGLAPYGDKNSVQCKNFVELIKRNICTIYNNGSIFLNMSYFNFHTGLTMTNDSKWQELFGFARREEESKIEQHHSNLALAVQIITEEIVLNLATEAKRLTNSDNLCMAGGVALNCVANGKLNNQNIFNSIYVQPAAGDSGGAIGAALAANHIYFNNDRLPPNDFYDKMSGAYLGPEFTDSEVIKLLKKQKPLFDQFEDEEQLITKTAELLADGKVIGWFQGRMEFGPRALGARSILADARDPEMQKKLNLKVKFREGFRPFAPIILAEDVDHYFENGDISPYMLFTKLVRQQKRFPLPSNFEALDIDEKLHFRKSEIPAATHVDYSSRIQTVHKETNLKLWRLLNSFKAITGCSVLINTSFNVRGEPIVNTPEQAYNCFMKTNIDHLIIGNLIFNKS
jgi:carbamoyltransferase